MYKQRKKGFVSKLGLVVHHHELEYPTVLKNCFVVFKVKVTVKAHNNQSMTVYSEPLILLEPNLI